MSSCGGNRKNQNGGTYKPAEYHGLNSGSYSATPKGLTTSAYGPQVAVSQGVLHNGVAGPNLAWNGGNMMTGGRKHRKRQTKSKTSKRRRASKPKRKTSKKHRGGCGCGARW